MSSVKSRSICMCLYRVEVCTHLSMVWCGYCRKCELHNWGDVPGDNLWSDPAMEESASLGVYYRGHVVRIANRVYVIIIMKPGFCLP